MSLANNWQGGTMIEGFVRSYRSAYAAHPVRMDCALGILTFGVFQGLAWLTLGGETWTSALGLVVASFAVGSMRRIIRKGEGPK